MMILVHNEDKRGAMNITCKILAVSILMLLDLLFLLPAYAQVFDLKKFIKPAAGGKEETKAQVHATSLGISGIATKSGIRLSLPSGWQVIRDEPNSLDAQGPNGMWLAIVMNDYGAGFPIESSLQAYKDSAIQEKGQGKLISWEERIIDGVRGIQRVESPMPDPDDPRRITWIGYKGTIGINIVASSKSRDFDSNYQSLDEVVSSIRW